MNAYTFQFQYHKELYTDEGRKKNPIPKSESWELSIPTKVQMLQVGNTVKADQQQMHIQETPKTNV